jgi:hypothetical protein
MAGDPLRAEVICQVSRNKVPRTRAPEVHLELVIPRDVADRLVVKKDEFADEAL